MSLATSASAAPIDARSGVADAAGVAMRSNSARTGASSWERGVVEVMAPSYRRARSGTRARRRRRSSASGHDPRRAAIPGVWSPRSSASGHYRRAAIPGVGRRDPRRAAILPEVRGRTVRRWLSQGGAATAVARAWRARIIRPKVHHQPHLAGRRRIRVATVAEGAGRALLARSRRCGRGGGGKTADSSVGWPRGRRGVGRGHGPRGRPRKGRERQRESQRSRPRGRRGVGRGHGCWSDADAPPRPVPHSRLAPDARPSAEVHVPKRPTPTLAARGPRRFTRHRAPTSWRRDPGRGQDDVRADGPATALAANPARVVIVAPTAHLKVQWAPAALGLGLAPRPGLVTDRRRAPGRHARHRDHVPAGCDERGGRARRRPRCARRAR